MSLSREDTGATIRTKVLPMASCFREMAFFMVLNNYHDLLDVETVMSFTYSDHGTGRRQR